MSNHDPAHGKKWGSGRKKTSKHISQHLRRKRRQVRALERLELSKPNPSKERAIERESLHKAI